MYKFNGSKYITKGIESKISLRVQIALWQAIDKLKQSEIALDYLQVFNIITVNIGKEKVLKIEHKQEQPAYCQTYVLENISDDVDAKIFVIDDVDYVTMLLAEEY